MALDTGRELVPGEWRQQLKAHLSPQDSPSHNWAGVVFVLTHPMKFTFVVQAPQGDLLREARTVPFLWGRKMPGGGSR